MKDGFTFDVVKSNPLSFLITTVLFGGECQWRYLGF